MSNKKSNYEISEPERDSLKEYLTSNNLKIEDLSFPKSQADRIFDIIKKLQESDSQSSADRRHIIALAKRTGIEEYKAEKMVDQLMREGVLIEKSSGRFQIV